MDKLGLFLSKLDENIESLKTKPTLYERNKLRRILYGEFDLIRTAITNENNHVDLFFIFYNYLKNKRNVMQNLMK